MNKFNIQNYCSVKLPFKSLHLVNQFIGLFVFIVLKIKHC
jgi:hypothetical protein